MIYTPKNCNKKLADARGNILPYVYRFDDQTYEVSMYVPAAGKKVAIDSANNLVTAKTIILGAHLV